MVSISRKKGARKSRGFRRARTVDALTTSATTDGLSQLISDDPKRASQLAGDERQRAEAWFDAYIRALDKAMLAVTAEIPRAAPGDDEKLIAKSEELSGKRTAAQQEKNAYFDANSFSLRPPSQAIIDRTMQLGKDIAERIAAERRAEAIVDLVNDLAGIFTKLRA
jgi:outer membrane protein OmpA-like peptidoglycan-associated protein